MEMLNEEKIEREQPQESFTLNAEEQQIIDDKTLNGSLMDKFKTVDALQKAYVNLEKQFTQKCQKVKELTLELEKTDNVEQSAPEFKQDDWEQKVEKFFAENPQAQNYIAEISKVLEEDEEIATSKNSLSNALTKVLASKFVPHSALIKDQKFLEEYVYSNKEISDTIINKYLEDLSKERALPLMSSVGGTGTFTSPVLKPKTITEAGKMAEAYFKN